MNQEKEKKEKIIANKKKIIGRLKKDCLYYEEEISKYESKIHDLIITDYDPLDLKKLKEFLEESQNAIKDVKAKIKLHEEEYIVLLH